MRHGPKVMNAAVLEVAVARGVYAPAKLADLAAELRLPLHVAATPEARQEAAALLRELIARPAHQHPRKAVIQHEHA
jgi:hypothetical protein